MLKVALELPIARLTDRKVCSDVRPSLLAAFACARTSQCCRYAVLLLLAHRGVALMVRSDAASFPCYGSHPHTVSHGDFPFPIKVPIFKLRRKGYIGVCSPWPLDCFSLPLSQSSLFLDVGRSVLSPYGSEVPQVNVLKQKQTFGVFRFS